VGRFGASCSTTTAPSGNTMMVIAGGMSSHGDFGNGNAAFSAETFIVGQDTKVV